MTHSTATVSSTPPFRAFYWDGIQWTVREDCMFVAQEKLFDMLQHHEQHPELTLVRENNVRASFFMDAPEEGGRHFFIKHYKVRGWQDVVKYVFLPLKAASEWRNIRLLDDCGLSGPSPIAIGIKKSGIVLKDSCLIVEALFQKKLNGFFESAASPVRCVTGAGHVQRHGMSDVRMALFPDLHVVFDFHATIVAQAIDSSKLIVASTEFVARVPRSSLHPSISPFRLSPPSIQSIVISR